MNRRTPSPASVLVVDDEQPNVALLVRLPTAEGYEVHAAFDGESALVAIERHGPDLILLDVQLPGLDGFEICRRVKQIPETRLIPVVMVASAEDAPFGFGRHGSTPGWNDTRQTFKTVVASATP